MTKIAHFILHIDISSLSVDGKMFLKNLSV